MEFHTHHFRHGSRGLSPHEYGFANLRTLKLTIDDELVQSWQEDKLANGRMARVLRTAPRLECLEMSFLGIDDDEEPLEKWSSGREFDVAVISALLLGRIFVISRLSTAKSKTIMDWRGFWEVIAPPSEA